MLRTTIAFIVASCVIALFIPMAIAMEIGFIPIGIYLWTLIVVVCLVPFTALPIYLVVTGKFGLSVKTILFSAVLSSSFVGFFFVFPIWMESSRIGEKVLVENGSITAVGYLHSSIQLTLIALSGVVAGMAFYWVKFNGNKS